MQSVSGLLYFGNKETCRRTVAKHTDMQPYYMARRCESYDSSYRLNGKRGSYKGRKTIHYKYNMKSIPLIRNNEISITQEEWILLNNVYTKEELTQLISDAMVSVDFPFKKITLEDALKDFENLQKFDATTLIKQGKCFTKRDYTWGISDTYIDQNNIGSTASNYFHQEARMKCDSINSPSPFRVWNTEKFRKNMLKNLWSMPTNNGINSDRLRQAMSLRNYVASQFKPSAAKAVYTYFNSEEVLDFSSGWGDRLAGFAACPQTKRYVGVDPNIGLISGYAEQEKHYKVDKIFSRFINCAEDMLFLPNSFDTIFTSPPYFDIERYTQDVTQSWKRYKGVIHIGQPHPITGKYTDGIPQNWLDNFLCKAINNAWSALKPTGILAINISDVYCHHLWQHICDPMNDYISLLPNAEYLGTIGYRMAKRPNSLVDECSVKQSQKPEIGKVYIDPIWIWRKN